MEYRHTFEEDVKQWLSEQEELLNNDNQLKLIMLQWMKIYIQQLNLKHQRRLLP